VEIPVGYWDKDESQDDEVEAGAADELWPEEELPARRREPKPPEIPKRQRAGRLGEIIHPDTPKGAAQVWVLGWRCLKCGWVWVVRDNRGRGFGDKKEKQAEVGRGKRGEPGAGGVGEWRPKKCPGCDGKGWAR
jgi:hypothetical protein